MLTIKDAKKAKKDAKKAKKDAKKAKNDAKKKTKKYKWPKSPTRYPLTDSPMFEDDDDKQGDDEFGPVWCFCEGAHVCSFCGGP